MRQPAVAPPCKTGRRGNRWPCLAAGGEGRMVAPLVPGWRMRAGMHLNLCSDHREAGLAVESALVGVDAAADKLAQQRVPRDRRFVRDGRYRGEEVSDAHGPFTGIQAQGIPLV